jgi:hypothetical protein
MKGLPRPNAVGPFLFPPQAPLLFDVTLQAQHFTASDNFFTSRLFQSESPHHTFKRFATFARRNRFLLVQEPIAHGLSNFQSFVRVISPLSVVG